MCGINKDISCKQIYLKIPKGASWKNANRKTDNTMANKKEQKDKQ